MKGLAYIAEILSKYEILVGFNLTVAKVDAKLPNLILCQNFPGIIMVFILIFMQILTNVKVIIHVIMERVIIPMDHLTAFVNLAISLIQVGDTVLVSGCSIR